MTHARIQKLQEGLNAAHTQVVGAVEGLSEVHGHEVPEPDEWTVAQLLAHIAEIQAFWTEKAVLITQEEDPNITRTAVENDIREAAVTGQADAPIAELLDRCGEATERAMRLVGEIDPDHLDVLGHRGESNPITVEGVILYLTEHIVEHVRQIEESRRIIESRAG